MCVRAISAHTSNRFSLAMYLIERGAEIDVGYGAFTPLHDSLVIRDDDPPETVADGFELFVYLFERSDQKDSVTATGTLLSGAAGYGNEPAVRYLLERGLCDVNAVNASDKTALIHAARRAAWTSADCCWNTARIQLCGTSPARAPMSTRAARDMPTSLNR